MATDNEKRDRRMDELEGGVRSDVSKLQADYTGMATEMQGMSRRIGDIFIALERLNDSNQTNWSTLAGWAVVILSVVAIVGSLAVRPLEMEVVQHHDDLHAISEEVHKQALDLYVMSARHDERLKYLEKGE